MLRRIALLAVGFVLVGGVVWADKPKVLVLPLPVGSPVERDVARAFDARLLVALEGTGRVATLTPSDDPECTTLPCLAALGATAGAAHVLSLSIVRERDGLTLFGALIDTKTAATARRAELGGLSPANLSTTAPAEVARQIAGAPAGPVVVGVLRPASGALRTAADSVASQLAALRTFSVVTVGTDHASLTHLVEISISELAVTEKRHHVRHYFEGVLVGTLTITDLADRRVLFTKTVKVTASERRRYSSAAEVTALLVEDAVTNWMAAFRTAGIEPRLRGGTSR